MNSNHGHFFGRFGVECVQPKLQADMNGPQVVQRRLEYLAANPDVLQQERHRFSISPPLPRPSPTFSTLSTDPDDPARPRLKPGQRDQCRVNFEWHRSIVSAQYQDESALHKFAGRAKVKADWIAQGIWDDGWDDGPWNLTGKVWKHERPLTDDEEDEDSEDERDGASGHLPHHPPSGLASTQPPPSPPKPRMTAYMNVKANWVERGLWYRKWGQLPGLNWKHELPQDPDELWMEGYTPPPRPPRIQTRPFNFLSFDLDSSPESVQEVADFSSTGGNLPLIIPSEVLRKRSYSAPAEVYPSIEAPDEVSVPIAKSPTPSALSADLEQGPERAQGPGRARSRRSPRRGTNIDSVVSGSISKAAKGQSPVGRQTRSQKAKDLAAELELAKPRQSARLQAQKSTPP
ncbi:hypothetical protein AUP68_06493 [Ilyonectria robusta]